MQLGKTNPIRVLAIIGGMSVIAVVVWLVFLFGFVGADLDRVLSETSKFGLAEIILIPIMGVILAAALLVFSVAWVRTMLLGWRTVIQLRHEIPLWQRLWFGSTLMFFPRNLTTLGVENRSNLIGALQWLGMGVLLLVVAFAIGIRLAIVQGVS